jgi:phospholipase/lecithinase/hemolysin
MVVDLPDLSLAPLSAGDRKALSKLAKEHNRLLAHELKALDRHGNLPGINVIAVTLKEFFKALPRETDFGTAAVDTLFPPPPPGQPPVSLCLLTNPANCPDVPTFTVGQRYFFWDAEHPTTLSHALLAQYFVQSLEPEP